MLKFSRKNKKLVIPVGINPSYNIDSSTLYNVSDADVVANDVIVGKIAYGADGKIVGTLDVESEKEKSYNEGIKDQKAKLETITITDNGTYNREDGYNEVIVNVPDLNGDYNEGYNDGLVAGREEIIDGQSDATITPQTVFKGEIGYGVNNERIVGEYEYVEGFDFGKIGYSQELSNEVNRSISDDIAYSKQLYDAWDPNRTSAQGYFQNNKSLVYAPNVNCSNIVNGCQNMFNGCSNLAIVPALNTSNCQYFGNMFYGCSKLTTVSLIDTGSAKAFDSMFYGCSILTTVPLFNTSNVTNMSNMFYYCPKLTSVPQFDTSNVSNMYNMFYGCSSLTTVPLFNTSNVTNMNRMFYECSSLKNVPLFDTSKITDISYMFAFDTLLSGAAPNFNLSSATNVRNMFMNCSRLTSVPQYDLSNVVTLGPFLYGCSGLTSIPDFNTTKATNYSETFKYCYNVVSIGLLDMSSATEVYDTFGNCGELENITGVTNCGKGFTGTSSSYHNLSFSSCSKITKQSCLNIFNTIYDMTNTSVTDAKITLHATTKALLSADDIAIATNKGWTIQ